MKPSRASCHELRGLTARATIVCFVLALAASPAVSRAAAAAGLDLDLGIAEHAGGYVLELDAPAPKARGKCFDITLSNFAKLADRRLWLVVRSMDGGRPVYESVVLLDAPAQRVGTAPVCLSQPPEPARGQGLAAAAIQVAVYRAGARDLATGFWAGPEDDSLRLSNWLSLPDTVLRGRLADPDRFAKSRAAR